MAVVAMAAAEVADGSPEAVDSEAVDGTAAAAAAVTAAVERSSK